MDRRVDDKPVQPIREFPVCGGFQVLRRVGKGWTTRCHRFRSNQVLTIEVCDGGRFPNIRVTALLRQESADPHGRHRHVVIALHIHAIADKGATRLVRFPVMHHAALTQRCGNLPIVIVGEDFSERAPEVPEESFRGLDAANDLPGQRRQPEAQVIAAPLCELRRDRLAPVLCTRLPAVIDHAPETMGAHQTLAEERFISPKVSVHM